MGEKTKIEWTDASWTPIRAFNKNVPSMVGWHCEHVTEACQFCYAEGLNKRLGTRFLFKPGHRKNIEIFLDEKMLLAPLRWKRPRMIFVCSMTDLFADFVTDDMIDRMFAVMALCPQHTFQCLTKRPARMRTYLSRAAGDGKQDVRNHIAWESVAQVMTHFAPQWLREETDGPNRSRAIAACAQWPLPNVWLGTSVHDQASSDEFVPLLLDTPAAVRFVSYEPALGPVDFTNHCAKGDAHGWSSIWKGNVVGRPALDWIICGGESGTHARPIHPDWARSVRDQCASAGVAFHFKQWGEWIDWRQAGAVSWSNATRFRKDGTYTKIVGQLRGPNGTLLFDGASLATSFPYQGGDPFVRIGKKRAGRLLDGRTHDEFPTPESKEHLTR